MPFYSMNETLFRIALAVLAYASYYIIYRIYFHPLSHIPGPRLAAVTGLYKTYYSYNRLNPLFKHIEALHAKYGSVVRIAPNEIHLSNPDNYDKIYYVGSKYTKDPGFYGSLEIDYSSWSTVSNELHRIRRGALSPMFSRKIVLDLEYVVQDKAQKLAEAVRVGFESGQSVDLFHAFRAVSIDVITDFAFNKCYNLLELPDFGQKSFFNMVQASSLPLWIFQQFPLLRKTVYSIPEAWMMRMSSVVRAVLEFRQHCLDIVLEVKKQVELDGGLMKPGSRPTIFQRLLTPEIVPGYTVPSDRALRDESNAVLGAAADTTGNAMTVATYHTVKNPEIYRKLTAELKQAFPDPNVELDLISLEKLPYLTGVVKEGLRLSYGVPGRLPRVVPEQGAKFDGYAVPPGTVVAMSSWTLHNNPEYFESPTVFNPDRWSDPEKVNIMEKAFVPFSKGSRMCVGMQLAYSELYITLGTLFRRFDNMKSNVLTEEDLTMLDYFASYYPIEATKFHVSARE